MPFIPQHQFSANADYHFDIKDDVLHGITIGANVKGQGKTYWEANNEQYQKFYATLGAHLTFNFSKLDVDIWGRNITGTKYNTFLVNSALTQQSFAQQGLPFHAGIDVRMHF